MINDILYKYIYTISSSPAIPLEAAFLYYSKMQREAFEYYF